MISQCQCCQIELTGGVTQSIFVKAESILISSSRAQEGLEFVASRKDMTRYCSVMDFLFCEIFQEYRQSCVRYYEGTGPMLKEIISSKEIAYYDDLLVKALGIAEEFLKMKEERQWRKVHWTAFRSRVLNAA